MVALTVDVERDCPPYGTTYRGVEEGLPELLDVLAEWNTRATFFFTGNVAARFPEAVKEVVRRGHELGSHGYNHRRLDKMPLEEAEKEIEMSLEVLRKYYPVVSFRAPNLQLPDKLFPLLESKGVAVDSSKALYKGWKKGITRVGKVVEVPVSVTSSILRLPWGLQRVLLRSLGKVRVLFVHPWEFVPMRDFRPDCTFNTGKKALVLLEKVISYHVERGFKFVGIEEIGRRFRYGGTE